jgi:hypothetical protein
MWGSETGYSPFNKYEFLSLRDCRNVQAYDINGDGWVDVIFGEKAPLSDWRNGRITIYFNNGGKFSESNKLVIPSSTNYGILMGMGSIGPPAFFDTEIFTTYCPQSPRRFLHPPYLWFRLLGIFLHVAR